MDIEELKSSVGSTISFDVYPSAILTTEYRTIKVLGVMNHQGAAMYIAPAQIHATVYPTLPEGTVNDYRLYDYLIVQVGDKPTAIGIPWIKLETVKIVTDTEVFVNLRSISTDDVDRLRKVLTQNGFGDFDIGVKQ